MKINVTLEVSDALRHHIGKTCDSKDRVTKGSRAKRAEVVRWLQARLVAAEAEWQKEMAFDPQLSIIEKSEARLAIDYLRKAGRTDQQIEDFLLLERARYRFPLAPMNVAPVLGDYKDGM